MAKGKAAVRVDSHRDRTRDPQPLTVMVGCPTERYQHVGTDYHEINAHCWIGIDRPGLDVTVHMNLAELKKHRARVDEVITELEKPLLPCPNPTACWYCQRKA